MKVRLVDGLPYVSAVLRYGGKRLELPNVLLDTGSMGTLFSVDALDALGLQHDPGDTLEAIRGVGGKEYVFLKKVESLAVGDINVQNFVIEVGAMNYGFNLDGIIGMDFLQQVNACIDLGKMAIYPSLLDGPG